MKTKNKQSTFSRVNPYDLSSIASITQQPFKMLIGDFRSSDIFSAGGKNSSSVEGASIKKIGRKS